MSLNVAIIDYGMGNLFSVQQACQHAEMDAVITLDCHRLSQARALILPGVGAFGDAIATLKRLDLVSFLQDWSRKGKPLIGICLGMQLLMSKSFEFGEHEGLDILSGEVVRFQEESERLKVPQIGWNRVFLQKGSSGIFGLENQSYMYFVHSYYVRPRREDDSLTFSHYGQTTFCSGLHRDHVVAFQFHPERSGPQGLKIYQALARWIETF